MACLFSQSIFQIYMDAPLDAAIPTVTELMTDNDRHKQRAAAEFIGGKAWSGDGRRAARQP